MQNILFVVYYVILSLLLLLFFFFLHEIDKIIYKAYNLQV